MSTRSRLPSKLPIIHFVVIGLLLLAAGWTHPGFAQQTTADTNYLSAQGTTEPSVQPSLPDTPSAMMLVYSPLSPQTLQTRFKAYSETSLQPYSVIAAAISGMTQLNAGPAQWNQGARGYGYRVASGVSQHAIAESMRLGLAALDGEDPRYHRSEDTSVLGRARHAFVETFTSQTADGSRMPAYSRFVGAYGSAFASTAYDPYSRSAGWAMRRGSTAIASSIGLNLLQEFAPRNKYTKLLGLSKDPR
jgi:hypothetical protein